MKTFACTHCDNSIHFKNVKCLRCNHALGFDPGPLAMVALRPLPGMPGVFVQLGANDNRRWRYCANKAHGVCNWLTLADDATGLCSACDLNRTIPNLSEPGNLEAWHDLERAKKRLVYSLCRFRLPLDARAQGKGRLTFDFARDTVTGHLDGVISVDIMEADAVERERNRQYFDEPYRTLLGHLRHESGHFYWMVLVEAAGKLEAFRALFGDERQDYRAAIARHHASGPPANWQDGHVSAYASAHPWEDFAETWAHYLHMVDALDTAEAEGVAPRSSGLSLASLWPFKRSDIYRDESFLSLMERWLPLTIALNSMTRSMGHSDFYPFVISVPVHSKLAFVHSVIRAHVRR